MLGDCCPVHTDPPRLPAGPMFSHIHMASGTAASQAVHFGMILAFRWPWLRCGGLRITVTVHAFSLRMVATL
jgi:hypothetical protein